MVMQGEYTGVYPGSSKGGPTSSGGGEYCISLHQSACVGVTSYERENQSQVSREEYDGVLLEMLISEVGKMSISFFHLSSPWKAPCPPLL
jgi:hypothetical protein